LVTLSASEPPEVDMRDLGFDGFFRAVTANPSPDRDSRRFCWITSSPDMRLKPGLTEGAANPHSATSSESPAS